VGKTSFPQFAGHFLSTGAVYAVWTSEGVVWMLSRFPPVVHQLSPGYPLLVHKVIHTAYPQTWITRVGNL
jgi:hypothetical protein